MNNIIEKFEAFTDSAFYLNWLHPLIYRFLPQPKKVPHGLSLHKAMEVVHKNGLTVVGHLIIKGDDELSFIEIIETVKK